MGKIESDSTDFSLCKDLEDGSLDRSVTGQEYERRQCTDPFCSVVLLCFVYGLYAVYCQATRDGNLAKLTHGFDWKGDICGVDNNVADRPLLFWCTSDLDQELSLLDGICVSKCPTGEESRSWCPGEAKPFRQNGPVIDEQQQVMIGMVRNLTLVSNYPTREALGYCFPTQNSALMKSILDNTHVASWTKQAYLACHGAVESWRFLIGVGVVSVGIGYLFLLVLWYFFAKLIYILLVAVHALLLFLTYASVNAGLHEDRNFFASYASPPTARTLAWGMAVLTVAVWALYTIASCYSRNAINVTIDSVKASCEVLAAVPSLLLQPLLHSALLLTTLLSFLYGFAWLLSTGEVLPEGDSLREGGIQISGLRREIDFTSRQWAEICYWIFGTVWLCETVSALGQFAISHAVVMHSCYKEKQWLPVLHGYAAGVIYHLGTLAVGGFIIGCLKIVATVLALILRQVSDQNGVQGAVVRVICCCCLQCVSCLEQLMTMVNDLVYTDVALRSVGYLEAADNVVRIAASNPATYVAIRGSAVAVRVLGVTAIGGLGTLLSYKVLSSTHIHQELDGVFAGASSMLATSNIIGTTIAAGLICFYIAISFMMVFYQTTYTLMYCMLIGVIQGEEGDTSPQQRELMSPLKGGSPLPRG